MNLNCGHTDEVRPFGWPITIKEWGCDAVNGYHKQVACYYYCRSCYVEALETYPELIVFSEHEASEYLHGD